MLSVLLKNHLIHKFKVQYYKLSALSVCRMMSTKEMKNVLVPPSAVRGMKELDRGAFQTSLRVPRIVVKVCALEKVLKQVKPFILKMDKLQPVVNYGDEERKSVLLNPNVVFNMSDLNESDKKTAEVMKECEVEFNRDQVELKYENWRSEDIFEAVLPEGKEKTAGYSRVGHIIHLNLREHLKDYRFLIGQVLLDKLQGVRSVVNKVDTIDNEFRNFKMEILAGEDDMVASVKENGCTYEFDFSRVFWNPRLCTEHERVVAQLKKNDSVLYDVFAGVGPFSIPAAKLRKCEVLANDLNPDSFHWLKHNVKLNKVEKRVQTFNMDARDFIRNVVKQDVLARWQKYRETCEDQSVTWPQLNVVMNLPALAFEFLDSFIGLLKDYPELDKSEEFITPTIHCYMFIKDQLEVNEPVSKVESVLNPVKLDMETTRVSFVRSVAPNKEMMKICFKIPRCSLFQSQSDVESGCSVASPSKRVKLDLGD